jgi:hypothetical protein
MGVLFFSLRAKIYFKGTDRQLEVIRIRGKDPGLTLLIFGGIHGDEPGGYFSCELLEKISLMRGTLIIVPRVNFPAIMLNKRELYGDMNRKFIENLSKDNPDYKKVKILKKLMSEADVFINQHDASGFHRKKYFNKLYNPLKYGQSLIVDTAGFFSKRLNREIDLEDIGRRIVDRVNRKISDKKHHFCFWNHNSIEQKTKFQSMKKSATYYALTKYSIPAFGLETSKDLPDLHSKVKYQMLVIGKILDEFGFKYNLPRVEVKTPRTYWVELLKNDSDLIRVNLFTIIRLSRNDRVKVVAINSNYHSGLSVNILGFSTLYDLNKDFIFEGNTKTVHIKKNNFLMGKLYYRNYSKNSLRSIKIEVDDRVLEIPNWGVIKLKRNQGFRIIGHQPEEYRYRFDVRGFPLKSGRKDDSGLRIFFQNLLERYSFFNKGRIFYVKILLNSKLAGGFQLAYTD